MNDDEILRVIAHNVVKKTQGDATAITRSSKLTELGLTSIDVIEVLFDVEEDLKMRVGHEVKLDDADIAGETVGDLVEAVKKTLSPGHASHSPAPPVTTHPPSPGKHS